MRQRMLETLRAELHPPTPPGSSFWWTLAATAAGVLLWINFSMSVINNMDWHFAGRPNPAEWRKRPSAFAPCCRSCPKPRFTDRRCFCNRQPGQPRAKSLGCTGFSRPTKGTTAMGYALIWIESLAASLLLLGLITAWTARWSRRLAQVVVPGLIALLLLVVVGVFTRHRSLALQRFRDVIDFFLLPQLVGGPGDG